MSTPTHPLSALRWAIVLTALGIATAARAVTKEDLRNLVSSHRSSLGGYEYSAEMRISSISGSDNTDTIPIDRELIHCKSLDRAIYADSKKYIGSELHSHYRAAFNGKLHKSLRRVPATNGRPAHDKGGIAETKSVSMYAVDALTRTMLWCPECDPARDSSVLKDLLLLLDSPYTIIDLETTTIFGSRCIGIHGGNGITAWLDIDHGGIVRRVDYFNGIARTPENLTVRKEIPELAEIEGRYFPTEFREYVFLADSRDLVQNDGSPKVVHRMVGKVDSESVRFGIGLEDFDFDFPDGTIVVDMRTGMDYIHGEVNPERKEELSRLLSGRKSPTLIPGITEELITPLPDND